MKEKTKRKIAVLDTETNWYDQVMSVGIAIADADTWNLTDTRYYIITPECKKDGMYSDVLEIQKVKTDLKDTRINVIKDIITVLKSYDIDSIFAYNAIFDYKHLPELSEFAWYDIMKLAAYNQYNKSIPSYAECYGTGRLKKNYGVEPIMRMLSGSCNYYEVHNALCDAVDELKIIRLLGHDFNTYKNAKIN